jgi:hypothetical protein
MISKKKHDNKTTMIITISEKSGIERGYKLIIYGPSRVD